MTEIDLNTPAGRQAARDAGLLVPDEVGQGVTYTAPDLGATAPEMAERISEKEFQARVVAYAKAHGFKCYHTYDSRRSDPGFPDWIFARERILFVELKAEDGRLTADQKTWLAALANAGGEVYCWRPSDWPTIEALLKRPEETCR